MKKIIWKWVTARDGKLKFPYLKGDCIGIQLGFDMNYPVTSDLFTMQNKINKNGLIIGIDPDPRHHKIAQEIIHKNQLNIRLVEKGTASKKGKLKLLYGAESSWNQLESVEVDSKINISDNSIEVNTETLDQIVQELKIDVAKIAHINLTINGAEYDTLLGMAQLLESCKNLSLTIIAGRPEVNGIINGKPDFEVISELLKQHGFTTKFKRIHQLFWWGFVVKLLLNRKWIYSKDNFGVIMATKGNHKLKWYQSFS